MGGILLPHVPARQTAQFRINERDQVLERRWAPLAPLQQKLRDVVWLGDHGSGDAPAIRSAMKVFCREGSFNDFRFPGGGPRTKKWGDDTTGQKIALLAVTSCGSF
jgi:hypothetical protein